MPPTGTKTVRRTFGVIPPEPKPIADLQCLAPKFRRALDRALEQLRGMGYEPRVVETLRTAERQQWLHGFGRLYDDGRGVVTHSFDGDESWHFYGLAADVVCARKLWAAPRAFWDAAGRAYARQALEWGGDWTFRDFPHVQWGRPMRRSPSPRASRLWSESGPEALWKVVEAL